METGDPAFSNDESSAQKVEDTQVLNAQLREQAEELRKINQELVSREELLRLSVETGIHAEVQYMIGELEVVQSQLDICALHEDHLIEMLDTGWIEEKLEQKRDLDEARVRATIQRGEIE